MLKVLAFYVKNITHSIKQSPITLFLVCLKEELLYNYDS